jgi:hypothetical protein
MDFQTLLFFYLLFTLGTLSVLFLIKGKKRLKLHSQVLKNCEYCLTPYLIDPIDKVTTCPQCGSKNH